MEEQKISWKAVGQKMWSKGLKAALDEEVTPKTENPWDDYLTGLVDKIVEVLTKEEEA